MAFRRFVLEPAKEIAPNMTHPLMRRSVQSLLNHLDVAPNYIAVTGATDTGKARLVRRVAAKVGARAILSRKHAMESTGRSANAELEFLDARCHALQDVLPDKDEPYSISGFWFDQSIAYAAELPSEELRQAETYWLDRSRKVATPKLIILVELPEESRNHQTESRLVLQHRLREQLAQPNQPPVLRLSAHDAARNEDEVAAAIRAM
jgi:hypothetical protein